jgi:hypothetical protein
VLPVRRQTFRRPGIAGQGGGGTAGTGIFLSGKVFEAWDTWSLSVRRVRFRAYILTDKVSR